MDLKPGGADTEKLVLYFREGTGHHLSARKWVFGCPQIYRSHPPAACRTFPGVLNLNTLTQLITKTQMIASWATKSLSNTRHNALPQLVTKRVIGFYGLEEESNH